MTISAGARLGPYEILSPLGAGGMGKVYRRFTCSGIWLRDSEAGPAKLESSRSRRFGRRRRDTAALFDEACRWPDFSLAARREKP